MYTFIQRLKTATISFSFYIVSLFILKIDVFAQDIKALPGNGSYSQIAAPQGGLRYQRQFYLITPAEMQAAQWYAGIVPTAIGFTNGVAQSDTTKARFKVYLQNTTDNVSRFDTSWVTVTTSTNSLNLTKLYPGKYEWQVSSVCSGSSLDTASATFSNEYLAACLPPTSLTANNISASSAVLSWVAPASAPLKYFVLYSRIDSLNWKLDSTLSTSFTASGLMANKLYQWRVWSKCSGDTSAFSSSTFATEAASSCNAPAGLMVGAINDTSAQLSWAATTGAIYYSLKFRRTGTTNWSVVNSFTNSYKITAGLKAGTTYEWNVATICAAGSGVAISGAVFTTTGTVPCYAPANPTTNNITDSSATLTWASYSGASSYLVRYRLRETISWTNAVTPMTLVHNDSIIVPKVTGSYAVPFKKGNTFNYTGSGVYIAWEYERPVGKLRSLNTSLSNTQTSTIVSFSAKSDTSASGQQSILSATSSRPETSLYASIQKDSVKVGAIYALGRYALGYSAGAEIIARITNYKQTNVSLPVTLIVKDTSNAIKFTATQTVSFKKDTTILVSFTGWTPTVTGTDSIIVSVPDQVGENVFANNSSYYLQKVTNSFIAYDDGSQSLTSAGFEKGDGLLLSRFSMAGCGSINAAHMYLTSSSKNHSLYAVVLNAAGIILATSETFTPDSTQTNNYKSFYFTSPPTISNADYYIGLAQIASASAYNPLGVQWETTVPRNNAYYSSSLTGGTLTNMPQPGRLMIIAEIAPGMATPYIAGNSFLCEGTTNTLQAASATIRYANRVVAASSQTSNTQFSANQVLGTPNVFPSSGLDPNAWISSTADGSREYLVLAFANPAPINYVDVYQTFGAGAIDTIFVKNPVNGLFEAVYSATAKSTPDSLVKQARFPTTNFNVSEVRIALNSPVVTGFNAIDAVAIGIKSEAPSYANYLWTPGGSTASSITVSTAGNYSLSVTDAAGCTGTTTFKITTPVTILPIISATGSTTFCQGDSIKLTSNRLTGNLWSTGEITRSIFVKSAGSYTVSYNDGSGCGPSTSVPTVIVVNNLPTVSILGSRFICSGTTTVLDAGAGFASYLWSTGATTQTITVDKANTYTVTVTNSSGCKGMSSLTTEVIPSPTPLITGKNSFCPGSSTSLNAGSGFAQYLWSNGATSQIIVRNASGLIEVTVTDSRGCTGSSSVTTTELTAPSPVISGTLSFCGGNSTTLDAGPGFSAYLWSTGAATQSLQVTTTGTYTATVRDGQGCSGSASVVVAPEGEAPPTPGTVSGPTTNLCNSTGNVYSITPVTGASYYVWAIPDGATITAGGGGSTSITVSYGSTFTSGYIEVAAANACGQSSSLSPRRLILQSISATPGTISGPSSGICSATSKTYSIGSVSSASSYTWTVPAGATINSGQGTTTIVVSFAAGYTTGSICVKSNSSCGSSDNSCLVVAGLPSAPGPISGVVSVCSKQRNVTYSIQPVAGATSYNWTVPSQASVISGQGTSSIVVNFGTKSGNITVKANASCGSSVMQSLSINMSCTGATTAAAIAMISSAINPETQLAAYPNPSNGIVNLRMPNVFFTQSYEVKVFDAQGKNVPVGIVKSSGNTIVLDLKHLAKGLYLINVSGRYKKEVVKVVLQ